MIFLAFDEGFFGLGATRERVGRRFPPALSDGQSATSRCQGAALQYVAAAAALPFASRCSYPDFRFIVS